MTVDEKDKTILERIKKFGFRNDAMCKEIASKSKFGEGNIKNVLRSIAPYSYPFRHKRSYKE